MSAGGWMNSPLYLHFISFYLTVIVEIVTVVNPLMTPESLLSLESSGRTQEKKKIRMQEFT